MTDADSPGSGDAPLTDAYRVVRRVAPPDAPCPGVLARRSDERVVTLVDARLLADWPAWEARAAGHVLAPGDLVRCAEGTDVELEHCTESVGQLLARRALAGAALCDGELVTLAVSLVRGIVELAGARARGDDRFPRGQWWVTDAGRPVFVHEVPGAAGEPAHAAAAAALAGAAEHADPPLAELLSAVAAAMAQPHELPHALSEAEDRLFALAEPTALELAATAPLPVRRVPLPSTVGSGAPHAPEPAGGRGALGRRLLHAAQTRRLFAALQHRRSRPGVRTPFSRIRGRRGAWLMAAAVAASVLLVGLLWPAGRGPDTGGNADAAPAASATARAMRTPSASPVPSGESATPVAAASALLDARRACAGVSSCLHDVIEDPSRVFPHGASEQPGTLRRVTLLDEFGGAAVLRVEAPGATTQLIVVVRAESGWLLRDVRDAAALG